MLYVGLVNLKLSSKIDAKIYFSSQSWWNQMFDIPIQDYLSLFLLIDFLFYQFSDGVFPGIFLLLRRNSLRLHWYVIRLELWHRL